MLLKNKSLKQLRKQAWQLCSQYIRRRDKGRCYTCGKTNHWKAVEAGHWKHGKTKVTFFEPDNIHCQCYRCNRLLSGNATKYTLFMIKQYGVKRVEELEKLSQKEYTHTRDTLVKWIEFYQKKLNEQDRIEAEM